MSLTIDKRSQIPDAPYYVLANDRFLSGWGPATNMTNTVVLPCEDLDEAWHIKQYTRSRGEMSNVRIVHNKPRLRVGVLFSLLMREDAPAWYGR